MNQVIETILQHRSIRSFEDRPLSDDQIRTIVECAEAASTSSLIQAYSIIGVKDKETKQKLAELSGNQSYVENNGHFFVFCADLYRHKIIGEMENVDFSTTLESTEKFMVALIDTALAAQNAAIAAESMGLGVCYIGGLQNNLHEVCKLLKIPQQVIPLFGLAVGYPAQDPDKKPRLPFHHIYHEETYQQDRSELERQLKQYNETVSLYYKKRTSGKRDDTWTKQMSNLLSKQSRMYMKSFVESRGFSLK
mgnify:CR=1 FL=1